MTPRSNPALEAFVSGLGEQKIWGQVLIRGGKQIELRHVDDAAVEAGELRRTGVSGLRKLATFADSERFRPLRSSPDLQRGWVHICGGVDELWGALQILYPGSIPDWFAARQPVAPVTNYREFTNRQSGMYRITQFLTDEQASNVTLAACHGRFCLKRRLWTVTGLAQDSAGEKSEIPCLEPCAILLELARKAARIEQEEKVQVSRSELASLLATASAAVERVESVETRDRTGNISAPLNPRRLQLLIEKFRNFAAKESSEEE